MHLIDLSRWFLGDFVEVEGFTHTYFWDMPVDDNGFCAANRAAAVAWLHASCTEWKNLFSLRDLRPDGKLADRRPRRQLRHRAADVYRMLPEMGPPETTIREYPRRRSVLGAGVRDFVDDIRRDGRSPCGGLADALPRLCSRRRDLRKRTDVIITRSPLRISLGGGGTDLPSYYREHGGFLIAAAIDKYVYITLHQTFMRRADRQVFASWSGCRRPTRVQHPIIREALKLVGIDDGLHLEITSMADIPAGTGLGSSGSFTTALLKALHAYKKNLIHPQRAGRAGLPHRDRPAEGADRQAGPVHRRLRRPDLLQFPPRTARSRPCR